MDGNLTSNSTNGTNSVMMESPPSPGKILASKVLLIFIAVIALIGNGMVMYLVARRRRLRTKTNAMVASLAFSDFIVAVALIPSFVACMYVKCDNQLSKLFYDVFLFISVLNLCCITTDRFLAVTRPLRYHMKMTRKTVSVMISLSWAIPTVVCLVPVTWYYTGTSPEQIKTNDKIFYTIQVVFFMFTPCLIMLVAYLVVFNIAWKQSRHIRNMVNNLSLANNDARTRVPLSTNREAKATLKVFGTVVLVFVFCWSLSAFRSIVTSYDLMKLSFDLIMTSRLLLVANSAINPIIYALWKRDIKMEIRKIFRLVTRTGPTSSGTFRSSDFSNGLGLARKRSRAGSMQEASVSKCLNKPVGAAIVHVAMAENDKTEAKVEEEQQREPTAPSTSTPKDGIDNLAAEVDGMV